MAISPNPAARASRSVLFVCTAILLLDGFDLLMYGTVVPSLLAYEPWALSPAEVGAIGSYGVLGTLCGSFLAGVVADTLGRKRTLLFCVTLFSLMMAACAIAPNPELLGLFRFLTGLGLGGAMPICIALTAESAPLTRRQLHNAIMLTSVPVGGVAAALIGLLVVPAAGFRSMFWLGAAPLLVILPLAARYIPEDPDRTVAATARTAAGRAGLRKVLTGLFAPRFLPMTLLCTATAFFSLVVSYGLTTWLPTLMQRSGYSLGSSISFLLVLNAGAIVGLIPLGRLADRFEAKWVLAGTFTAAAAGIALISAQFPMWAAYVLVAIAGFGALSGQLLINGVVASLYPDQVRASAVGWVLSSGRTGGLVAPVLGGVILGSGLAVGWNFLYIAASALLAALAALLIPRAKSRVSLVDGVDGVDGAEDGLPAQSAEAR